MELWLATDKSGDRALYSACPTRKKTSWSAIDWEFDVYFDNPADEKLKNHTWDDDPIKIRLDWVVLGACKIIEKK